MDKKTFSIGFVVVFTALTIYLYYNDIYYAQVISNDGFMGVFWYFISNPAYILLFISIYLFNSEAGFLRNTIGATFIIYASDIISYPRLLSNGFPKDVSILASSDGLVITKIMNLGFSYSITHTFYYLILPILLMVSALAILGIQNFFRRIISR